MRYLPRMLAHHKMETNPSIKISQTYVPRWQARTKQDQRKFFRQWTFSSPHPASGTAKAFLGKKQCLSARHRLTDGEIVGAAGAAGGAVGTECLTQIASPGPSLAADDSLTTSRAKAAYLICEYIFLPYTMRRTPLISSSRSMTSNKSLHPSTNLHLSFLLNSGVTLALSPWSPCNNPGLPLFPPSVITFK